MFALVIVVPLKMLKDQYSGRWRTRNNDNNENKENI